MAHVMAGKRSRLEELNDDVWGLILDNIYRDDRTTIRSISCVSKRLNWVCIPWRYRSVCINLNSLRHAALLYRLMENGSELASYIRELRLEEYHEDSALRDPILKLISCLPRLESFSWDNGNPDETPMDVLDAVLVRWPTIRLIVDTEKRLLVRIWNTPLATWVSSSRLHTLIIRNSKDVFVTATKIQLLRTIRHSPHLKVFQLWDFVNDRQFPGPPATTDFDTFLKGCPKLEEFSIQGYGHSIFALEELKAWGAEGMWEDLKILRLRPPIMLPAFVDLVPSLEVLEISRLYVDLILSQSYSAPLGVLKELHIDGSGVYPFMGRISSAWSTLTHLTLHNSEGFIHHRDGRDNSEIYASRILRIKIVCPNLTHLTIDVWREGKWPYPLFASLGRLRHLYDLTLVVEHSNRIGGQPVANADASRHIFQYIQEHKLGKALRRLVLKETPEATYRYSEYLKKPIPHPTLIRDFICRDIGDLVVEEEEFQYVTGRCVYSKAEPSETRPSYSMNPFQNLYKWFNWTWETRRSGHERSSRPTWAGRRPLRWWEREGKA